MHPKKILLVEDNPDDVELTLRALRKSRIVNEVTVATDGEEALKILSEGQKNDSLPAVVLLDLKLPKVSGFDVLKQVRASERTKFLPVVILTSSKEESDLINGYSLGVNSYIRKPVDFIEFAEVAKNVGLYWLLLNEVPPM
ncbi:MAG: response regulator [Bacteroidetes bacterium]|nr:response regulator [Bacteroidota bacterium]